MSIEPAIVGEADAAAEREVQGIDETTEQEAPHKIRVYGFVDGFNLYHALDSFRHANTEQERTKYQKYKWLYLWSLLSRYVQPQSEALIGVHYFTAYPIWNPSKELRHKTYVSALINTGVRVTFGEFKQTRYACRATCQQEFISYEEKQTDVNISTAMISLADSYDKAILLTEDSDQVPTVRLLKKLYPEKSVVTLPPIGRNSKELTKVCDSKGTITEQALVDCQLPNPISIVKNGRQSSYIVKPNTW